eukprot:1003194-Ditylum_brightwellii.AAC.2
MGILERLDVFQYFEPGKKSYKNDGWQYALMHMIFDVKHNLSRKARFVVGGHVINLSGHMTYSSTIKDISVRLLMLIVIKNGLGKMSCDIRNDFLTAPCNEKILSIAREEFGQKKGCGVVLKRALYGLKTVPASFCQKSWRISTINGLLTINGQSRFVGEKIGAI